MKRIVVSSLLLMMVTLIQPLPVSAGEMDIQKLSEESTATYSNSENNENSNLNGNLDTETDDAGRKDEDTSKVVQDNQNSSQGNDVTDTENPDNTQGSDTTDPDNTQNPTDPLPGETEEDGSEEEGDGEELLPGGVRKLSGNWMLNGTDWWFVCEDGSWPADEIVEINGIRYAFNKAGYMITGWYLDESGWYYFDGSGAMHKDWLLLGSTWYYLDGDDQDYPGRMTADCEKVIRGARYFFTANGDMRTEWVLRPEGWYYVDKGGGICKGWQLIGGAWYYLDAANAEYPGLMCSDEWAKVNGAWYYLTGSGAMATGWIHLPEGWYYADGSGARKAGWLLLGGTWYYLDAANEEYPGLMCSDEWAKVNGAWYYLTGSGAMATGWIHLPEGWYYADGSGARKTGWQLIGGNWYYLDGADEEHPGLMVEASWKEIGGKWYYLTGSGAMAVNWVTRPEGKYYVGTDGARKTGWQSIGGYWYYFYTENDPNGGEYGVMATNTVIDGWNITASGIGINGSPDGTPDDSTPGGGPSDIQSKIEQIKKYEGAPYVLGGTTPSGWDCSGFTQWALKYLGASGSIPRTAEEQAKGGINVNVYNMSEWKPGDILVYTSGGVINHVALYLGNGKLMHALNPTVKTKIQGVEEYNNWDKKNTLVLVRRYL